METVKNTPVLLPTPHVAEYIEWSKRCLENQHIVANTLHCEKTHKTYSAFGGSFFVRMKGVPCAI